MNDIPISEVQMGVQAILDDPLPPLVPSRSPRPSIIPSRSNLPRPAALIHRAPKGKASVRKAMNIIKVVEAEARAIAATLDFEDGRNLMDDTLRTLLDTAAKAVDSGGKSLGLVRNQAKAVVDFKNEVLLVLRSIDARISQLGALLLPASNERTPIMVETSKFYGILFLCILA